MRYLVLSDLHANRHALDAVLADAAAHSWDQSLVLGDLVGYGGDPNGVIARIRELAPAAIIRGNHDKVAAGIEPPTGFNPVAYAAIQWTAATLTPDHAAWLAALPRGPIIVDEDIEICHGTPYDEDVYLVGPGEARRAADAATRPLCLFGHTHLQMGFRMRDEQLSSLPDDGRRPLPIEAAVGRLLVNPGAVGQPRDRDPRAAYAIVDTDLRLVTLHRVAYPIDDAQRQILRAGLPPTLASRLAAGR